VPEHQDRALRQQEPIGDALIEFRGADAGHGQGNGKFHLGAYDRGYL
jgi:hypothetical protein